MAELGTDTASEQQAGAGQETEVNVADQTAAETPTAGEGGTEAQEGDTEHHEEPGKAKTDRGIQRKIDKLTRRTKTAEEEAAYWRGQAEALKSQQGGKTEQKADTADLETEFVKQNPRPQADQFESNAQFVEALTDWKLGLRDFKQEQTTKRTQETANQQQFSEKLESQRTRGEEKYEDFEDLVSAVDDKFTPAMVRALVESDKGEDIAYYLASNPAELQRIGKLNPYLQAKEVGRIEAGLEAGKIQTARTVKRISTAPEPAPSAKGSSGSVDTSESRFWDEKTTTAERIAISRARRQSS